jgi:hypothetical protein
MKTGSLRARRKFMLMMSASDVEILNRVKRREECVSRVVLWKALWSTLNWRLFIGRRLVARPERGLQSSGVKCSDESFDHP